MTDYTGIALLITAVGSVAGVALQFLNFFLNQKTHDLVNGLSIKKDAAIAKVSFAAGVKSETDKRT